ncbi:MAG: hypothetical protein ABL985_17770 [Casimicrobium sp.]
MQKHNIENSPATITKEDVHSVRRANLHLLLREFSQARINAGEPANGTEKAFAEMLQVSKSLLSQLKTSRPISDANAKQIEVRCKKPADWMSAERAEIATRPAPGEESFIALARAAYRVADRAGRVKLRAMF